MRLAWLGLFLSGVLAFASAPHVGPGDSPVRKARPVSYATSEPPAGIHDGPPSLAARLSASPSLEIIHKGLSADRPWLCNPGQPPALLTEKASAALKPADVEAYQRQYDELARRELERVRQTGSIDDLFRFARKFRRTSYGPEGARLAFYHLFDRGELRLAAHYADGYLADHGSDLELPGCVGRDLEIFHKAAYVYAAVDRVAATQDLVKKLAKCGATELEIAGVKTPVAEVVKVPEKIKKMYAGKIQWRRNLNQFREVVTYANATNVCEEIEGGCKADETFCDFYASLSFEDTLTYLNATDGRTETDLNATEGRANTLPLAYAERAVRAPGFYLEKLRPAHNEVTRQLAAKALEIGDFPMKAEDLGPYLSDGDSNVSHSVMRALSKRKTAGFPILLKELRRDRLHGMPGTQFDDPELVSALGEAGKDDFANTRTIMEWIRNEPGPVRSVAALMHDLGHEHPETVPLLMPLLDSPDANVRENAIVALTWFGDKLNEEQARKLLGRMTPDAPFRVKAAIASAVAHASDRYPALLYAMLPHLGEVHLGSDTPIATGRPFSSAIVRNASRETEIIPWVEEIAMHGNSADSFAAVQILGELLDKSAVLTKFFPLLDDPRPQVREAAESLFRNPDGRLLLNRREEVFGLLRQAGSSATRKAAVALVGSLNEEGGGAAEDLIRVAKDTDPLVRQKVAQALASITTKRNASLTVPALRALIRDAAPAERNAVRVDAAIALIRSSPKPDDIRAAIGALRAENKLTDSESLLAFASSAEPLITVLKAMAKEEPEARDLKSALVNLRAITEEIDVNPLDGTFK